MGCPIQVPSLQLEVLVACLCSLEFCGSFHTSRMHILFLILILNPWLSRLLRLVSFWDAWPVQPEMLWLDWFCHNEISSKHVFPQIMSSGSLDFPGRGVLYKNFVVWMVNIAIFSHLWNLQGMLQIAAGWVYDLAWFYDNSHCLVSPLLTRTPRVVAEHLVRAVLLGIPFCWTRTCWATGPWRSPHGLLGASLLGRMLQESLL